MITTLAAVLAVPLLAAAPKVPDAIKTEHHEIHEALVAATKASGRVGEAAKKLAQVLHPHFVREEQIALPPLGLLAPLASGAAIPEDEAAEALRMSETLKAELPKMLEEHVAIRAAVAELRSAAQAARAPKQRRLADELAAHAATEEQVLYPAAILVGEVLRARRAR